MPRYLCIHSLGRPVAHPLLTDIEENWWVQGKVIEGEDEESALREYSRSCSVHSLRYGLYIMAIPLPLTGVERVAKYDREYRVHLFKSDAVALVGDVGGEGREAGSGR